MIEFTEESLRELLSPFADAGTTLRVRAISQDEISVSGTRRFQSYSFSVTQSAEGRLQVPRKRGAVPLENHLASGAFADLDRLARSMIPFLKARIGDSRGGVDGWVVAEDDFGSQPKKAIEGVGAALYREGVLGTSITFLHGDAGAGKSWLLMKIALKEAQDYLQRTRHVFPLYVDAQGINLRSLSQQIAHQLDVYNGVLRYTEILPLVRLGALGLIIDGFDELIMPSGYNDTYRALMSYVEGFKGTGALVASTRTAFLHAYTDTPLRADPVYPYVFRRLRLCPWTSLERRLYAESLKQPDLSEKLERLASATQANEELLGRPFLVAHTFDLLRSGKELDPAGLVSAVENAFIERERIEKLQDPDSGEPLLSRQQFEQLLAEVAEEMWLLRQNSLDRQTARTVASLVAESFGLPRSERELVEARIDTHAFLEVDEEAGGRVRFPHEIIFSRILARRILEWLVANEQEKLKTFLRVAPLKVSMAEQFVDLVAPAKSSKTVRETVERLCGVVSEAVRSDHDANVRLNVGSLVVYLLPLQSRPGNRTLHGLHFSGVSFGGAKLNGTVFKLCFFQDFDARGTDWKGVDFVDCFPIGRMEAAEGQEFPASLPPVNHLRVYDSAGRYKDIYGSRPAREVLFPQQEHAEMILESLSERAQAALDVLRGLCLKASLGHHWIPLGSSESDATFRSLRRMQEWDTVVRLLEKYGLLTRERRQRSGPNPELSHLRRPQEILSAIGGDRAARDVQQLVQAVKTL